MTRIRKLPFEAWDADFVAQLETSGALARFVDYPASGVMAHTPHMAAANAAFQREAMSGRRLAPRLLELVRLRLAFHNQCRSCMAMRFDAALNDGLTADAVCSLEKPAEAEDLTPGEKAALEFADKFALNHFAIDESTFETLREHFAEAEIVELGMFVAYYFGMGRLFATWDMTEKLPEVFQDKTRQVAPWMLPEGAIRIDKRES
jgi:alkylhydroperoxidase family enzyme